MFDGNRNTTAVSRFRGVIDELQVWRGKLPASARATPMTYRTAKGKQYVVIAAGGHDAPGAVPGDALVAFALPD